MGGVPQRAVLPHSPLLVINENILLFSTPMQGKIISADIFQPIPTYLNKETFVKSSCRRAARYLFFLENGVIAGTFYVCIVIPRNNPNPTQITGNVQCKLVNKSAPYQLSPVHRFQRVRSPARRELDNLTGPAHHGRTKEHNRKQSHSARRIAPWTRHKRSVSSAQCTSCVPKWCPEACLKAVNCDPIKPAGELRL